MNFLKQEIHSADDVKLKNDNIILFTFVDGGLIHLRTQVVSCFLDTIKCINVIYEFFAA